MVSFQQDLLLTLNNTHSKYVTKYTDLFNNETLFSDLSLENAEKLIEYIKEYKQSIHSICLIIDKINNIKIENEINKKIEEELIVKLTPIMHVYRSLLLEKYSGCASNQLRRTYVVNPEPIIDPEPEPESESNVVPLAVEESIQNNSIYNQD